MAKTRDYADKRSFDQTPEPEATVRGNVDPTKTTAGKTFMVHQHHATRLHFDLRLEMLKGIPDVTNTDTHLVPVITNTPRESQLTEDVERVLEDGRFAARDRVQRSPHPQRPRRPAPATLCQRQPLGNGRRRPTTSPLIQAAAGGILLPWTG